MMTIPRPQSQTLPNHAALISSLSVFYLTLIHLDYLREGEVQFPPHTGRNKTPLANAAIQSANLTEEAEELLHLLPYITPAALSLFRGEARITLDSKPLSYLSKGEARERKNPSTMLDPSGMAMTAKSRCRPGRSRSPARTTRARTW